VDSVGVEGNILDVEADTSHVFVSQSTFFGGPLEGGLAGVLDFVHELALLSDIDQQVGASGLGTETPDLLGIVGVPSEFVLENLVADLNVLLGVDFVIFDGLGELVGEGESSAEDSVVLVGGLREADLAGLSTDSFLVGDDGVTLLELALSEVLLEILEANFDVEFTAASDDVLA
jgi:hypothetical protein